jgi:hypothetical protein
MKTAIENPASLNEILFDVEMIDNPEPANSEYSYIVKGYGDFTTTKPVPRVRKNNRGRLVTELVPETTTSKELNLNYCSYRYELVPNADIFPVVRQLLIKHGIEFEEKYSHIGYARFYAQFIITDKRYAHRINGSTSDWVYPMLKVQHSYNGQTKYKIIFGYYRIICTNGLVIPVEEMKHYNLSMVGKHTEAIKKSLKKLNNTLNFFVKNREQVKLAITAKYETLAGNVVEKWQDRVDEVMNVVGINESNKNAVDTKGYIQKQIAKEMDQYGGRVNDWLIYNALNHYIYDVDNSGTNVKAPEVRAELDSKVFEYLLSSN